MAYIGRQPAVAALTASDITDGIVSNAKLAQDIISADTALGATPADTDEFLVSDAGVLKRMDYSYIKDGITQADQWRLTADISGVDTNADITSNLSQVSGAVIGSGMSESSGVFTFPETGVYLVIVRLYFSYIEDDDNTFIGVDLTTDNSSYSQIDRPGFSQRGDSAANGTTSVGYSFVDVTDTSNVKIKFSAESQSGGTTFAGSSSTNKTTFSFIRLGAT